LLVAQKSYLETYSHNEEYHKKNKNKKKSKKLSKDITTLLLISILFVIGFVIVFRYTALTELASTVNKQKTYLSGLEKTRSQLKTEVLVDLNTVDDIAKNKLAMDRPYSYQIQYVNVSNDNNVPKVADNSISELNIVKKMSKVVEFFY